MFNSGVEMTYEEAMEKYWTEVDGFFTKGSSDWIGVSFLKIDEAGGNTWATTFKEESINKSYARIHRDRYERHKILRETELYKAVYNV